MAWWQLLTILTLGQATAGEPANATEQVREPLDQAARLISHFPPGTVPVEVTTIGAIADLGVYGGRAELPLLANLVREERSEIRGAAVAAIGAVRSRMRIEQREAFANALPNWPELLATAKESEQGGQAGRVCAAYAVHVIGEVESKTSGQFKGDPQRLLLAGRPHDAVSAASAIQGSEARFDEAMAREEIGDVRGALQQYALLAAQGHKDAEAELDGFGIDTERLLLGMLSMSRDTPVDANDARVLETLVRSGGTLTVEVLAERTQGGAASDQATATDALVRMLEGNERARPLRGDSVRHARRALKLVSTNAPTEIREIALAGL